MASRVFITFSRDALNINSRDHKDLLPFANLFFFFLSLMLFFHRVKKHYKASEATQDSNTSKNQANVLDPNKQGGQK